MTRTTFIAALGAITLAASAAHAQTAPCDTLAADCYQVIVDGNSNPGRSFDGGTDGPTRASTSYTVDLPELGWLTTWTASADLSTGAARASFTTNVGGTVYASMWERFAFDLPSGVDMVTARVSWTVDGTTTFGPQGTPNGMGARFSIQDVGSSGDGNYAVTFDQLDFNSRSTDYQRFTSNGYHEFSYSGLLDIYEGHLYSFDQHIGLGSSGAAQLDYGNTAFFNIELPAGASIRSSSGVLLSNPIIKTPGAVPEPATWAMLTLGIGMMGAGLRTRRRDQAMSPTA
ncbi:PEP-CTERM sorting domain-containing protein [Sphingomonas sp. Leaf343]|uniref:PEP-CTERM sorting domain-containing protein n=1 Tax=Sphingomonas sp. Leaf343 TaxID=1736345 RepID=UPI0006FC6BD3|nr:PEP-CTERM sorting domain-containing protein [Sphingomonas sp. Leaf343]KQR83226.1 hypothetical protein ASG07_09730 [Sphingomonas sp. Leaf343]